MSVSVIKKWFCVVSLLSFLHVGNAAATDIIPIGNSAVKTLVGQGTDNEYVVINPPNSAGISVNTFTTFIVSGKALQLIPANLEDSAAIPAKLIVIKASKIQIDNTITLQGGVADILFIDSDASITSTVGCNNCRFENVGRVTLAAATSQNTLNENTTSIGKLSTFANGQVSVNGMAAPVQSVELIADNIVTAGEISTLIRGRADANGGFTVDPAGPQIMAMAGINLYAGTSAIDYETLKIVENSASSVNTSEYQLDGTIKAGMINIISRRPFRLKASATLSTQSDIIATGTHHGNFITMLEGIYIQTTQPNHGNIILDGTVITDNNLQITALNDLYISKKIQAYKASVFAGGAIRMGGASEVNAEIATIGAEWFANRGALRSTSLVVETEKALYNHFGGSIRGDEVTLISTQGTVINGSRTDKANTPATLPALHMTAEFTGTDQYGIYDQVSSEAGSVQPVLSATISANAIHIKSKRFENINPYRLVKPADIRWDNGVELDRQKARRVSVIAERLLEIEATEYVLNSSAVIGLNQAGSIDINSPNLTNQRYRVKANIAVVNLYSYRASGLYSSANREVTNVNDIGSYLTEYSPPGVLYTFGELTFSDGTLGNQDGAKLINQFSFLEVLSESNFSEAQLLSFGLSMAVRPEVGYEPVRCAAYGCAASTYTSYIEAETLTSFSGPVHGISSTLAVNEINQLEDGFKSAIAQAFIDDFKAATEIDETTTNVLIDHTRGAGDVRQVRKVTETSTAGNLVTITVSRCNYYMPYYGASYVYCASPYTKEFQIDALVSDVADGGNIEGLPWSNKDIREKAKPYIEAKSRSGSLDVPGYSSLSGTYKKTYIRNTISDDLTYVYIDYEENFIPTNASTLSEGQSRAASYYANSGSYKAVLEELMGSIEPNIPQNLRVSHSVNGDSVDIALTWDGVPGVGVRYLINGGVGTTNLSQNIVRQLSLGDNTFSFTVKACNTVSCSDASPPVTVSVTRGPTESELSTCNNSIVNSFKRAKGFTYVNGATDFLYYCSITTKNNTKYIKIEKEEQDYLLYTDYFDRCSQFLYFSRDAVVNAYMTGSSYPGPAIVENIPTNPPLTCAEYKNSLN